MSVATLTPKEKAELSRFTVANQLGVLPEHKERMKVIKSLCLRKLVTFVNTVNGIHYYKLIN